jgi:hypothetical protein
MRGVVVTVLPQPDPARDKHGIYRRIRMLLHAMKEVCDEIEIVHFARHEEMKRTVQANAMFSSFWGVRNFLSRRFSGLRPTFSTTKQED